MSALLPAGTRPARSPVRGTRRAGVTGLVVLAADGSDHVLNGSALALWQLCDGATAVEEMQAAVTELFGVPPDEASEHVAAGVVALRDAGLVRWA